MADTGTSFDVVVLGAGSGGYACALRASQLGMSVALVERDKLGGTCLHYGCIPTKALLHAGEVADAVRDSAEFGIESQLLGVDLAAVNTYKDGVVASLYRGLQGLVKSRGITVIEGAGALTAAKTVSVAGADYTGSSLVLASGSYTRTLPGLDLDGDRVLGSSDALRLKEVPRRAVVLGGGVIGVEFASAWRSLGADVTVIEALPRLVASEDAASSKALERAFRKRGITVLTSTSFASVERTDTGVTVTAASGDRFDADVLLVAVGRGPNTADLGFEANGVTVERGFVVTDERLHTRVRDVYAVGDIVAGMQLAHRGFQHGIFVAEEIAGLAPTPIDEAGIPRVTYSDPEIASVGLTEEQAAARYGADGVQVLSYNLGGNGRSQILKTTGFVKLVRRTDGPVVGVHMVGARVSELIGEAQLITNWEAFPEDVANLVHMHPTQNEALGEAHLALAGKPLHTHT
ncbi:MAG TPA: dihydrolipoyl dehydrogenase [Nocardioidaceae bacterium]|nr:dihydrolipoyl dehydrogenase [Nocardioidaceae bacterium]